MNATIEEFFKSKNLNEICVNSFDTFIKASFPQIERHKCHDLLRLYIDHIRGPLKKQDALEVERLKFELKNCNNNQKNRSIWAKKEEQEASSSKRKAKDDAESTRPKSRPSTSTSSKSVGIAPFLPFIPPFSTQLNCAERWLLGDLDLSSESMTIKNKCIAKYNNKEKMRAVEQLALDNIFFFSKKKAASITSCLKQSQHVAVINSIDYRKNQVDLPPVVDAWLLELERVAKHNDMNNLRRHLVSLLASEEASNNNELTLVASSLFSVVPKYRTWSKKGVVEDTFKSNQIADTFDIILGQDNDDVLQWECEETPVEVFVMEMKAPTRNRNSNDFIKLGFTLKSMLDSVIKRGLRQPQVLGLLIDGHECFLYMMTIEHEAIYKMVELDAFSLPKAANELHLLKNLLEAIFRVKAFALETFEDFEANGDTESELLPLCRFTAS
ncbi:hypothetical protein BD560DRAFT_450411 [Blakeslea trispora]|nr:hypothetical protein BD560DRAFT_450411 [Blakeslea trispora]